MFSNCIQPKNQEVCTDASNLQLNSLFNPFPNNHSMMKQTNLLSIATLFILTFLLFADFNASAQVREPLKKKQFQSAPTDAPIISPFKISVAKKDFQPTVSKATFLQIDEAKLAAAFNHPPREFIFEIPQQNGKSLKVLLQKQDILAPDFSVTDQDGKVQPFTPGDYYTGYVLNRQSRDETSMAALSIVEGEVMAMLSVQDKNYVLGAVKDGVHKKSADYVLYDDADLKLINGITCETDCKKHHHGSSEHGIHATEKAMGNNIVRVQFEADHQMFQDFGSSIPAVSNYITGLFNMVATIYDQEDIITQISRIVVWNIPDPYNIVAGTSSGDVLNAFRARKNLMGITGDLGHLLSTKSLGHGGIAWVDVLCHPETGLRTAYSNISSAFNNFPLYSWTIDVVTHEMGHNLGSWHTHDCVWGPANDQALDNCAAPTGGCAPGPAPANGGTIMSYCHLTAAGKNFNLGFGNEPGDLIRSKVNGAACLSKAFLDCANATPINCGDSVNGTTIGGTNHADTYGCVGYNESGPEKVYVLQTTEPGTITATLSNETANLDLIILDACSESNCLDQGLSSVTVANASAGMYYIVVDGYNGAQGNFTLTVNCSGYCFTTGQTNYEFIQRVEVGGLDNDSGNNYGYGDFTNIGTQLHRGGTASVRLTPGFINNSYSEAWRIWIDTNQDEDFDDAGELVFAGGPSTAAVSGTMNIPSSALLGKTRMRVAMRFFTAPDDCGTFSGEVEDYTVEILPYCPSLGITKYEFIDEVSINGFTNNSGNNDGYADFTSLTTIDLTKGEIVPISLTPGFTSDKYPEKWSVWIDYNNDFHFDDNKELVFSTNGGDPGTINGAFQVAAGAPTVKTRMRVVMYYGDSPSACNYSFYGETEDYLVSLTPYCAAEGNTKYEYIQTVGIGSLLNDSGDDGGYADFTDLFMEATAGEPTGLVLIPGFQESPYNENWRVWIDFNRDRSFESSELVFEGGPEEELVFGAFIIADSVEEGSYGLRVAMRYGSFPQPCGDFGSGEVEDYKIFINGGDGGNFDGEVADKSNQLHYGTSSATASDFTLFPNPAQTLVNIDWNNVQPVAGQLVSTTGQTLMTFGQNEAPVRFDVTNYPAGLYTLQVITAQKEIVTKRFIKVD
ncbi:MAG: GEVED domain-containing protein [Bacteroidota bacterium]